MDRDPFFWMTQDYEVEIRAREIQDSNQQELFCCNFGGHWSIEHKRFFRFPPNKVEKRKDGSWHEVEDAIDFGKEYEKYNRTPVGKALFLAKLEEAARLRCSIDEASFADVGCDYWDAVSAFDQRIGHVIGDWRNVLLNPETKLLLCFEENDAVVKKVVDGVEKAMKILAAKKVDLNGKRKRDDGNNSDSSWGSEMRTLMAAIDREYKEGDVLVDQAKDRRRVVEQKAVVRVTLLIWMFCRRSDHCSWEVRNMIFKKKNRTNERNIGHV